MDILRITAKARPEKELELKQAIKSAFEIISKFENAKKCFCKSVFEENIFYIEQKWESSKELQS